MYRLLFLLFVLIGCTTTSKLVPGEYKGYVPDGHIAFANNSYTFYEGGTFSYKDYTDSSSDGLFSNYGEGKYKVEGDRLILDYRDIDTLQSEITKVDFPCGGNDSVTYHFIVIDGNGKPLKNFVVIPEGANIDRLNKAYEEEIGITEEHSDLYDSSMKPNFYTSKTDRNGKLSYTFLIADRPTYFKFRRDNPSESMFIGGGVLNPSDMKITLFDNNCKQYDITASYQEVRYVSGDHSEEYKIKINDNMLLMKKPNGKHWSKMVRK